MNFAQRRPWFFLLSALVILPGVICLILSPGLKPGIDFTGGSSLTVQFPEGSKANQESIRLELSETGYNDAKIQNIGKQLGLEIKSNDRLEEMNNDEIIKFAKKIGKI